jgi:hypothetical protein
MISDAKVISKAELSELITLKRVTVRALAHKAEGRDENEGSPVQFHQRANK